MTTDLYKNHLRCTCSAAVCCWITSRGCATSHCTSATKIISKVSLHSNAPTEKSSKEVEKADNTPFCYRVRSTAIRILSSTEKSSPHFLIFEKFSNPPTFIPTLFFKFLKNFSRNAFKIHDTIHFSNIAYIIKIRV